jgi:hypothetical protein
LSDLRLDIVGRFWGWLAGDDLGVVDDEGWLLGNGFLGLEMGESWLVGGLLGGLVGVGGLVTDFF